MQLVLLLLLILSQVQFGTSLRLAESMGKKGSRQTFLDVEWLLKTISDHGDLNFGKYLDINRSSDNHSPQDIVRPYDLLKKVLGKATSANTNWPSWEKAFSSYFSDEKNKDKNPLIHSKVPGLCKRDPSLELPKGPRLMLMHLVRMKREEKRFTAALKALRPEYKTKLKTLVGMVVLDDQIEAGMDQNNQIVDDDGFVVLDDGDFADNAENSDSAMQDVSGGRAKQLSKHMSISSDDTVDFEDPMEGSPNKNKESNSSSNSSAPATSPACSPAIILVQAKAAAEKRLPPGKGQLKQLASKGGAKKNYFQKATRSQSTKAYLKRVDNRACYSSNKCECRWQGPVLAVTQKQASATGVCLTP